MLADGARIYHIIIDCPTWVHVERFCDTRLENRKSILVETERSLALGQPVIVALELPNQLVIAIDGRVVRQLNSNDGTFQYEVSYVGAVDETIRRVRSFIADAKTQAPNERTQPRAFPVPTAQDVPIDEVMPGPGSASVTADHQRVFFELERTFRRMRKMSAREVLGIRDTSEDFQLESAVAQKIRMFHPDRYIQFQSGAITRLSEDICAFIYRAAERLFIQQQHDPDRPLEGWLLTDAPTRRRRRTLPPVLLRSEATSDSPFSIDPSLPLPERLEAALSLLQTQPRNRQLRACYHFLSAKQYWESNQLSDAIREARLASTYAPEETEYQEFLDQLEVR